MCFNDWFWLILTKYRRYLVDSEGPSYFQVAPFSPLHIGDPCQKSVLAHRTMTHSRTLDSNGKNIDGSDSELHY